MWPFKCKHPVGRLGVKLPKPTITPVDEDFEEVTFHLHCWACGQQVDVSCTSLVGGADAFLSRTPTTAA